MRRFVIAVLYLIIFWIIWKFRNAILESFAYLPQFCALLPAILVFSLINLASNFLRWNSILKKIGYRIELKKKIMIYFAGFGAIASMVKFSDSVRILFLKKEGVRISHGLVLLGIERMIDGIIFSILLFLFFGRRSNVILTTGWVLTIAALLKYRKKVFSILEKWEKFMIIEDAIESAIKSVRELKDVKLAMEILFFTFLSYFSRVFSFYLITGLPFSKSLEAILVVGGAAALMTPTPEGLGFWETAVSSFIAGNLGLGKAIAAVLIYRLFFLWIPILLGEIALLTIR